MALIAASGILAGVQAGTPPPQCRPLPEGVSAWFPGETLENVLGSDVGTLVGDAGFAPGRWGQAFSFDGLNDAVSVPGNAGLDLQNFTIECWIRRGEASRVGNESVAVLIAGNAGAWVFGLSADGSLFLGKVGVINRPGQPAVQDTQWHHVAVTREGREVQFYVDGASAGVTTLDDPFGPSLTYGIGGLSQRYDNVTYGFLGLIDDVTVYRRALSLPEIAAQAANEGQPRCLDDVQLAITRSPRRVNSGQEFSVTTEVRNRSTETATAVRIRVETGAGMKLLGIEVSQGSVSGDQLALLGDMPSNSSATVTIRWRAETERIGWFTNRLILEPTSADRIASNNEVTAPVLVAGECDPVLPSTEAWWPADGDTREVFSGLSGVLTPVVPFVPGRIGSAFGFRNNLDLMTFPRRTLMQSQDFTVECWIRRESVESVSPTANHSFFIGGPIGSLGFGLVPDGRLYLHKIPVDSAFSTGTILDTAWHHVAVTRSGTDTRFYIDGAPAGAATYASVFIPGPDLTLGGLSGIDPNNSYSFLGDIDELALHSLPLSPEEVIVLAGSGPQGRCVRDLKLVASRIPTTVVTDDVFELEFLARQAGSRTSEETRFILVLPPGVDFISAASGQGVVSETAGVVRGELGTMSGGASVPITIRLRARAARDLLFEARLQSPDPDLSELNNSALFKISVGDFQLFVDSIAVEEGSAGTTQRMEFQIRLSAPRSETLRLSYATESGTALGGRDFLHAAGEWAIAAGTTLSSIPVTVLGDASYENTEEFRFQVTTLSPGPVRTATATGTIRNDDLPPVLRVLPGRWLESDLPVHGESFVAELLGETELPARFRWVTSGLKAREYLDFLPTSGQAEFLPGQTRLLLPVEVVGDNAYEGDESLLLRLSDFVDCRPAVDTVRGIIVDDDPPDNVPVRFTVETASPPLEPGRPFGVTLTAWDASGEVLTGFDGAVKLSARRGSGVPSRVVISEVAADDGAQGDFVELVNVSLDELDIAGWRLLLFGPSTWPDPTVVVTVPESVRLSPGQVLILHRTGRPFAGAVNLSAGFRPLWSGSIAANLFGEPLVGVLVQDPGGATEDSFMAGRADPAFMASGDGVAGVRWQGPSIPASAQGPRIFQRVGNSNSRSSQDWVIRTPASPGSNAPDLILPFADSISIPLRPESVRGFAQGRWVGELVFPEPVSGTALFVDDGNGHTGRSGFLATVSDLDQDGLPDAWEIEAGLSHRDAKDAAIDHDGDGFTALQEWVAGTDPRDRSSTLHLTIQGGRIEWQAVAGRRYRLEQVNQLGIDPWTLRNLWEPRLNGAISEDIGTDLAAGRLFRVVVEQIPPGLPIGP